MRRKTSLSLLVLVFVASVAGVAHASAACAGVSSGGDWPSFGHDLSNTRNQALENVIGTSNVANLAPAWTLNVTAAGGSGDIQSTPVIADGCMYATTSTGSLIAVNADSGQLVWEHNFIANGSFGGLWSPSIVDGTLYLTVSNDGATYATALNDQTGEQIWQSDVVSNDPDAFSNAGAVVFDGLYFIGLSGAENGHSRGGGWAILDATNGAVLLHEHTVPDADYALGYSGGSMWGTAVIDQSTHYLYEGTGQPSNSAPGFEHQWTNAIVKIDIARARDLAGNPVASPLITNPNFGHIVGAYKGLTDYGNPPVYAVNSCKVNTNACVAEDMDFGASPNLFHDSRGNTLVGDYQKAGIYHAAFADTMEGSWETWISPQVGPPYLANAAAAAYDGTRIINDVSWPGHEVGLDASTGNYDWVGPTGGVTNYDPTEVANGVVYINDAKGFLHAFDASSGTPLLARPMEADTQDACTPVLTSGGAAIARHTVYSTCGAWVIAYRLPG